jgi:putative oxidoreductase
MLIDWPARIARPFRWLAPLVARVTVGYIFLLSGWGKLNNLPKVVENFAGWGIPSADLLAPFVSAVEFGGSMLLLGLCTRLAAAPLAIVMIVAIRMALWEQVDSLETLLGFEEFSYLAIFYGWRLPDRAQFPLITFSRTGTKASKTRGQFEPALEILRRGDLQGGTRQVKS